MTPDELQRSIASMREADASREKRFPPQDVRLGTLTSTIMDGAQWRGEDEFPSSQLWSDEVERVLSFALSQEQFGQYLPHLRGRENQRVSALAELRVAFYLHRNQFKVVSWKPVGANGTEGEFSVSGPSGVALFVEVKSPGWKGELSGAERNAGRKCKPKYLHAEARSIAPWERVQFEVEKAYKKFSSDIPNLLVIADHLFVSLQHGTKLQAEMALYQKHNKGCFTDQKYQNMGGVGIFWVEINDREIWYDMRLFLNPYALASTALPNDMKSAFTG